MRVKILEVTLIDSAEAGAREDADLASAFSDFLRSNDSWFASALIPIQRTLRNRQTLRPVSETSEREFDPLP